MNVDDARHQLSGIYDHVVRSEVYRGYRSIPVACTGFLAVGAAAVQPAVLASPTPFSFVLYWTVLAAVCVLVAGIPVLHRYVVTESRMKRIRTRRTVGQLLPAVLLGGTTTAGVLYAMPEAAMLLPGLWAMFFGLGLFSSRPYLPAATSWVATFYCIAGLCQIFRAGSIGLSPVAMGFTFGIGQLLSSVVLYLNIERNESAS